MAAATALELEDARRAFGTVVAVDNVSLSVAQGEFVTLLGPSGSGKTSTLRLIGGFEELDAGAIRINGERIDHLPPYQRDTATIFQSGALFPHKTVGENIAFGLRMRGVPKPEISERVKDTLEIVRLQGFEQRYPSQLSGGQKQRVALARSMAVRPAILLFDEPLSALDLSLRLQLRAEIKRLHDELKFTAIYVTHDQGEAMAMSSRVAVMNRGRIEQIDQPDVIFHKPANEFVYNFIGESCCLTVRVSGGSVRDAEGRDLALALERPLADGDWRLYVRPSRFRLGADAEAMPNRISARVHFVEFLGDIYRYHLKVGALELFGDTTGRANHRVGEEVSVGWQSRDQQAFQ
ncbi:MAG: ABC transporter ATP-binding protein [Alphaproteobacteria bacterium]|nr:ABC transporter ATP-binding protein [Alphaproteobacteria bacterium]